MEKMKDVLLIFKTHLDIGFTDLAQNVIRGYLDNYIPSAIQTGYRLKDTDTPFVWTVGSWLINEALKYDDGTVNKAIQDGILTWHGMPFTTHTEIMSEKLFEYGLGISAKLDKQFGKKTIAAKLTDVPGHTIGMVPHLVRHGIEFLHIGVNPATPVPNVPPVFYWKCENSKILVVYDGGYGDFYDFGDFVLGFGLTNDNLGPQNPENIIEFYKKVRSKYPGANVMSATLNDVALRLRDRKFPYVENEIGDLWIHGVGTDPNKMTAYRALLREYDQMDETFDLANNLLLVPEHTWGLDVKTHFKSTEYSKFPNDEEVQKEKLYMESSWKEQRDYVTKAASVLNVNLCEKTKVTLPIFDDFVKINTSMPFAEISWQLFDEQDYEHYRQTYLRTEEKWAIYDFTKVGLPFYCGGIYTAKATEKWYNGETYIYKMEFDKENTDKYGLPCLYIEETKGKIEIKWFGKKASRLPQAYWLKLRLNDDHNWKLRKMGQWIDPALNLGNPLLNAVECVQNEKYEITPLDVSLAAPFGRHLLEYGIPLEEDLYFNLYNNVWNTNFPLWYGEDSKFRFIIRERK